MIKRKKKTVEENVAQIAQDYIGNYVSSMAKIISELQIQVAKLESAGIDQAIERVNERQNEIDKEFKEMISNLKPEESVRYLIEDLQTRVEHLEEQAGY